MDFKFNNLNNNIWNHKLFIQKYSLEKTTILLISMSHSEISTPKFNSIQEIKSSIIKLYSNRNNLFIKPIIYPITKTYIFTIQFEKFSRETKCKNSDCFNPKEIFLINILSKLISSKIYEFERSLERINDTKRNEEINNVISRIISERTMEGIIESMKKELSLFANFDHIGLLLYKESSYIK